MCPAGRGTEPGTRPRGTRPRDSRPPAGRASANHPEAMCVSAPPPTLTWPAFWPARSPIRSALVPPGRYRDELARHQYRPEWTWIAEEAGRILARAVWWGFGHAAHPVALDCVYADDSLPGRVALAAELIAAGQQALRPPHGAVPPRYEIGLPVGWRSDPAVAAALGWRRDAAARAGLQRRARADPLRVDPGRGPPPPQRPPGPAARAGRRRVPGGVPPDSGGQPGRDDPARGRRAGRRPPGARGYGDLPVHAGRPGLVAAGLHRRAGDGWPG